MVASTESIRAQGRRIEDYAHSLGAEIYGVASAETYRELFPTKPAPDKFVEGARSVILVGLPYSPEVMDTVAKPWLAEIRQQAAETAARDSGDAPRPPAGAERYYLGPENEMLTHEVAVIAYRLAARLRRDGHRVFYFPNVQAEPRFKTAPFYFMPAMYAAGLGQLGMNCSIISREHGPRFRVTAVITDLELPAGEPMKGQQYPGCSACLDCVRRCPSQALDGRYWKNVYKCASYGCCGTCLSVCPVGRDLEY